jgi:hypothetical protein
MESKISVRKFIIGFISGVVLAAMCASGVHAQTTQPAFMPPPPSPCSSQHGISCSEMCVPTVIDVETVKGTGTSVSEVMESQQLSMLAGRTLDFTARCPAGSFAIGGGYTLVPEGSTIDLNEIKVLSSVSDNTNPNGWNGWKVSVFRKKGAGSPENCLKVQVRAYCVQGQ